MLRTFSRDTRGSTAVLFSVTALVAIGAVGVAVDYSRMSMVKNELTAAVDAAALAAGSAPLAEQAAVASAVFKANYRQFAALVTFQALPVKKAGALDAYRVEATVQVPMTVSKVLGFDQAPVSAASEVVVGTDTDLLIGLVLDTTGSMAGARLASLKSAATDMVNDLYGRLKQSNQVKFAVIPFARYVNVGKGNRYKSWMSVPDDYSVTKNVCSTKQPVLRTYNCRTVTSTKYNDGIPYTSSSTVCDRDLGPPVTTCGNQTTNYKWNGCAGSRAYPLNTQDGGYLVRIPGILNVSCPTEFSNSHQASRRSWQPSRAWQPPTRPTFPPASFGGGAPSRRASLSMRKPMPKKSPTAT